MGGCRTEDYDTLPFESQKDYQKLLEFPLQEDSPLEVPQLRIAAHDRSLYPDVLVTLKHDSKGKRYPYKKCFIVEPSVPAIQLQSAGAHARGELRL